MALIQQHAVAKPTRAMASAPTGTGSPQSHSGAVSAASVHAVSFRVCSAPRESAVMQVSAGRSGDVTTELRATEIRGCSGRVPHFL